MQAVTTSPARWEPPTGLEEAQVGDWRIWIRDLQRPVAYPMFKLSGTDVLRCSSAKETFLQEYRDGEWKDWMTDQPPYWYSMVKYGKVATGRVLVLGLGMGLVLKQLAKNKSVTSVSVCERQYEVIKMVWPQLELDRRFGLVLADFFDHDWSDREFDTIIADFWVGKTEERQLQELFLKTYDRIQQYWPDAAAWYHAVDPWAIALNRAKAEHVILSQSNRLSLLANIAKGWK